MVYLLVGSNKIPGVDIYDECVYILTLLYFAPYNALQSAYLYLNKPIPLCWLILEVKVNSPLCMRLMWTLSFWGWQNFLPQKSHNGRVRCGLDAQP